MGKKRSKSARRRGKRGKSSGRFAQKLLVAVSGIVLILCAASVTYSFFFRQSSDSPVDDLFRIEIWNGTGKAGLAHAAMNSLRRRGIDVIEVKNAKRFDYPESILIGRKSGADVEELGRILGCRNVVEQVRDGTLEDATLILGADYRRLNLDWQLESDLLQ